MGCLGGLGVVAHMTQRLDLAEEHLRAAIAVGERVGWSTHPIIGAAYVTLGALLLDRGHLSEGTEWLERAAPILQRSPEPAACVGLCHAQGMLAFFHGRFTAAAEAFRAGTRLTELLRAPHFLSVIEQQWELRAALALGDPEPARAALADAGDASDTATMWCNLAGRVALAVGDAESACEAVAPVLAGETFHFHVNQEIEAMLVDGVGRLGLGEAAAARNSAERALALAEPQGRVWIFLTVPGARELLENQPLHGTAHAAHLTTLLDHLAGVEPAANDEPSALADPLSEREVAVLRFLPTNLSAGEIGSELFLSVHTVKTHMRKLYAKLDVHTRAEAVQRGRALGLLAPARRAD
jgi:LuxR family maltose regulon positive regulatory protein